MDYPHSIWLLLFQHITTVFSEVIALMWVFDILYRHGNDKGFKAFLLPGLALTLFIIDPWIYLTDIQDFHFQTFVTLFTLLATRDFWNQKQRRAWIWMLIALLGGDTAAIYLIGLGLSMVLFKEYRMKSFIPMGLGLGWMLIIMTFHADQGSTWGYIYLLPKATPSVSGVMGIIAIFKGIYFHIGTIEKMIVGRLPYFKQNLVPIGFIGIIWPWAVGIIFINVSLDFINSDPFFISPSFQNFVIYILGTVGTLAIISWLESKEKIIYLLSSIGLITNAFIFFIHQIPSFVWGETLVSPKESRALAIVHSKIPSKAEVTSSFRVSGRFAGRRYMYVITSHNATYPIFRHQVVFIFSPSNGGALAQPAVNASIAKVRNVLHAIPIAAGGFIVLYGIPIQVLKLLAFLEEGEGEFNRSMQHCCLVLYFRRLK